jgi:peptidoglycan/xylan/chitin deacetylase (PgdA/CDA1 family)
VISVDIDAESAMLRDHPQTASYLNVMAHQAYDARAGLPRLLELLSRHDVRGTFFVPGFAAERWPDSVRAVRDRGHEIGAHGYLHEPLHDLDEATEEMYILRGLDAIDRVLGVRPVGFRAPKFKINFRTPGLLVRHGFLYDSSLMDSDVPYRLATNPEPDTTSLIEVPVQWSLDDWSQFGFLPGLLPATTVETPAKALELWTSELDAAIATGSCFVLTLHPYLSGRPARAHIVHELLERMRSAEGLWIATADEIARHTAGLGLTPFYHRPIDTQAL